MTIERILTEPDPTGGVAARGLINGEWEPLLPRTPEPPADPPTSENAYRQHLLDQAIGYAKGTTGGGIDGRTLVVTSTANSGTGSLRDALAVKGPTWISFDPAVFPPTTKGATITVTGSSLKPNSDTTIDGRGAHAKLTTAGSHGVFDIDGWLDKTRHGPGPLTPAPTSNVIMANLDMTMTYRGSSGDADLIGLYGTDLFFGWHLTMDAGSDGAFDPTQSWAAPGECRWELDKCLIENTGKAMLFGNQNGWEKLGASKGTIHDCHWLNNGIRNPAVADGHLDFYNNVVEGWGNYWPTGTNEGSGAGTDIVAQGQAHIRDNVYINTHGANVKAAIKEGCYGDGTSINEPRFSYSGNVFIGTTPKKGGWVDTGGCYAGPATFTLPYTATHEQVEADKGAALRARLTDPANLHGAGWRNIPGRPTATTG